MRTLIERWKRSRNVGEVVGLLLIVLAVFSLFSLLSYDERDSAYFFETRAAEATHSNWFGPVGATAAESLLQLFGTAAFLVPLALARLGWGRLRPNRKLSYARTAGYGDCAAPHSTRDELHATMRLASLHLRDHEQRGYMRVRRHHRLDRD